MNTDNHCSYINGGAMCQAGPPSQSNSQIRTQRASRAAQNQQLAPKRDPLPLLRNWGAKVGLN